MLFTVSFHSSKMLFLLSNASNPFSIRLFWSMKWSFRRYDSTNCICKKRGKFICDVVAVVANENLSTKWRMEKRKRMENDLYTTVMHNNLHAVCVCVSQVHHCRMNNRTMKTILKN